ncbi:MAG: hypothetical protein N2445_04210 [Acidobacteria bacterium]|nr:hypothetical protein [Acidobacteriota bacterium]
MRKELTYYQRKNSYVTSPIDSGTHYPDFSQGKSAGIGVIESNDGLIYDTSSNQINGAGSAFYEGDMRGIQKTFNDGYVEIIGLRDGMGAVPYVSEISMVAPTAIQRSYFSQIWFKNKNPWSSPNQHLNLSHNYFHLIGGAQCGNNLGLSLFLSDWAYVFRKGIEEQCEGCDNYAKDDVTKETTNHEIGHQFEINCCNEKGHCINAAWCSGQEGCANGQFSYETCLMREYGQGEYELFWSMLKDGIVEMECDDLNSTGPECGLWDCSMGISVRTDEDPE